MFKRVFRFSPILYRFTKRGTPLLIENEEQTAYEAAIQNMESVFLCAVRLNADKIPISENFQYSEDDPMTSIVQMNKKSIALFLLLVLAVSCITPSAFAAEPRWTDVRSIELGVTYQGALAVETHDAAEGPEKYLLYCPQAMTVKLIFDHTDPVSNNYEPAITSTDPNVIREPLGYYLNINNRQTADLQLLRYHSEILIDMPAGYNIIAVNAARYTNTGAYTICFVQA